MTKLREPTRVRVFYETFGACGDRILELSQEMTERGFAAFSWRNHFRCSFCTSPTESQTHQRCLREISKLRLMRPKPPVAGLSWGSLHSSEFLDRMRRERDTANGVPESEVRSKFPGEPWRLELDPCERRLMHQRIKDNEAFGSQWDTVINHEARSLAAEANIHARIVRGQLSGHSARFDAYAAVMSEVTKPLGFASDKRKTSPRFPVFSKPIVQGIDLCWVLEEAELFAADRDVPSLRIFLELRCPDLRGRADKAALGRFLIIDYQEVVPDFANAYYFFRDLAELETVIRANVTLYSLIATAVQEAAKRAFS